MRKPITNLSASGLLEIDGIDDAAVVGEDDALLGERIIAFVVRGNDGSLDEAQLKRRCLARLSGFKVPARFEFVDALPRTANSKLQHHVLRNRGFPGKE